MSRTEMLRAIAIIVVAVLSTMRLAAAADAAADRARVDLFRPQHPASLVAEPVTASVEPQSMSMEPPAPPSATLRSDIPQSKPALPFEVSGEWNEPDRHVIVLEGMGRMFLLCRRCGDVRGAVRPGQELAGGYRVKSFDDVAVVLTGPDGRQHRLPMGGHPQ